MEDWNIVVGGDMIVTHINIADEDWQGLPDISSPKDNLEFEWEEGYGSFIYNIENVQEIYHIINYMSEILLGALVPWTITELNMKW